MICARTYAIPHDLLVGLIARIGRMLGIAAIRPGLHPAQLRPGLVGSDGVDEHGQPGFVGSAYPAVMTCLLERDKIVPAVEEGLTKRYRVFDDTRLGIGADAMGVRRRVLQHKLRMLLQRATAVVEVMHLHLHACRIAQRHQFLLHRVPGETIPDAENADE